MAPTITYRTPKGNEVALTAAQVEDSGMMAVRIGIQIPPLGVDVAGLAMRDVMLVPAHNTTPAGICYRRAITVQGHQHPHLLVSIAPADLAAVTTWWDGHQDLADEVNAERREHSVSIYLGSYAGGDFNATWIGDNRTPIEQIISEATARLTRLTEGEGMDAAWCARTAREAVERWTHDRAEADQARQAEQVRRDTIFAAARSTGQPQELRRWMDDCDGSRVDCSFDNLVEYAQPNGTMRTTRTHCY